MIICDACGSALAWKDCNDFDFYQKIIDGAVVETNCYPRCK
jgi:hypothetical protein